MVRGWTVLPAALCAAITAMAAWADTPAADGAGRVACDDYKAVERAALQDFTPVAGKFSHFSPFIRLTPSFLAPRLAPAKLVLPDADRCDVRASSLRPGKNAYSCLWKSEQPDFAAADQAKRIALCLDADVTKSDFSSDLTVVTKSNVRFRLITEHHYDGPDGYAVRLLVDGPQF
jgi:hypothetical protein